MAPCRIFYRQSRQGKDTRDRAKLCPGDAARERGWKLDSCAGWTMSQEVSPTGGLNNFSREDLCLPALKLHTQCCSSVRQSHCIFLARDWS